MQIILKDMGPLTNYNRSVDEDSFLDSLNQISKVGEMPVLGL